jgi:hypothetical protein
VKPRGSWLLAVLVPIAALLVAPPAADARPSAAERLVRAYSPILFLRTQSENPPCDTSEEQFEPTTVDTFLGNPRVKLIHYGHKGGRDVATAPTAARIAGLGKNYFMNLPGDPLDAGCTYAKDFAALKRAGKAPAVTYAHLVREAGTSELVVEYWFFWYFNQFNDLHEGDWEGMQIAFQGGTPKRALQTGPYEIALYQHAGGEKASWDDDKVQKRGTHPIVYPAAGSHATFYDSAVYLGNGQHGSGVGCDNTSEPVSRLTPTPRIMPGTPAPGSRYQWLTYRGRWGQKEKGLSNNGPTGPYGKPQWRRPITWMEGIRSTSPKLPGGSILGPATTGVFCGAVSAVSQFINLQAQSESGALVLALIAAAIIIAPIVLTRWRPVDLSELRQKRAFGQLLRATRQLYGRYWLTFLPIGLTALPILGSIEGIKSLLTQWTGSGDLHPSLTIGGFHLELALDVAGFVRFLAGTVVTTAIIAAVALLESKRRTTFLASYRLALSRFWRLIAAAILFNVAIFALLITLIGIPIAAWKYIDWQFIQQEILFEDRRIRDAFRGSSRTVRNHWLRTLGVAGFLELISVAIGPVLGFFLIFANFSLTWVNLIGSLVYALLVPYVAIGRTLLYLDLQARKEVAERAPRWRRLLSSFRRWRRRRSVRRQPGEAPT